MNVSAEEVKKLREKTGAGVMECKKALVEAHGDFDKAVEILRQAGLANVEKKADRVARQGLIEAYIHAGGRVGAMIELNCETDFVARNEEFKALAHDIAMQVAAMSPAYVSPDDVPVEQAENKAELALLSQQFIKDPSRTVRDIVNERIAKFGERIVVRRFVRYELGAE